MKSFYKFKPQPKKIKKNYGYLFMVAVVVFSFIAGYFSRTQEVVTVIEPRIEVRYLDKELEPEIRIQEIADEQLISIANFRGEVIGACLNELTQRTPSQGYGYPLIDMLEHDRFLSSQYNFSI